MFEQISEDEVPDLPRQAFRQAYPEAVIISLHRRGLHGIPKSWTYIIEIEEPGDPSGKIHVQFDGEINAYTPATGWVQVRKSGPVE